MPPTCFSPRRIPGILAALLLLLNVYPAFAQIEPHAGTWKTWVIASGKAFRLPPPPDKTATKAELQTLLNAQQKRDSVTMAQITYWNAGAPGYRWNEIAETLITFGNMVRLPALLNVAIYDATVAAWDTKYAYRRARPSNASSVVKPYIPVPDSPSYPCEHSVAAGAAAAILGYIFPEKADSIWQLARQASESRMAAGVQYPTDVAAGLELGRKVAQQVIARAKTDGSDAVWKGEFARSSGKWYHEKPVLPLAGTWKPWALASGNQFRPAPPPDCAEGMKELRAYTPDNAAKARAYYWASAGYWQQTTDTKIFEHNLQFNPPRAARVYALSCVARMDAFIACFDAKYTYLALRPEQYDTTFVPLFLKSPPHPSYPSGHATASRATAAVLSYLFPQDQKLFVVKAHEAAQSRFEGGIHFRVDNEAGLELGRKVGEEVVKWARQDGADKPVGLVRK